MFKLIADKKIQLFLVVFLTFLAYSNIFRNQFVIGDSYISSWPILRSMSNIPKVFLGLNPENVIHAPFYRPMNWVIYMIYYQLFGENPLGYHFHSIIVHLLSTVFVYFIAREIVYSLLSFGQKNSRQRSRLNYLPFIAALLFGLHPVLTESVAYISASIDSTGRMLLLAAFLSYLKADKKFPKYSKLFLISQLIALFAFLIYEVSLILPILIIWYDFCFGPDKFFKLFKKKITKIYGPFFFLVFVYFFLRVFVAHIPNPNRYLNDSMYLTAITMVKSFAAYIFILIFPSKILLNREISPGIYSQVNEFFREDFVAAQSIFDFRFLFAFFCLVALILLAIFAFRRWRIISFAIGWFFISLLPVSNIIPLGVINSDRYLYVASFGYVLILGYVLQRLVLYKKQWAILVFCSIVTGYFVRTWIRNLDYKNDHAIWQAEFRQLPNSPQANFVLGNNDMKENNTEEAILHFQKIADDNFLFPEVYDRLGQLYSKGGNKQSAMENFTKALRLQPDSSQVRLALNKLGVKPGKRGGGESLRATGKRLNTWIGLVFITLRIGI